MVLFVMLFYSLPICSHLQGYGTSHSSLIVKVIPNFFWLCITIFTQLLVDPILVNQKSKSEGLTKNHKRHATITTGVHVVTVMGVHGIV